MPVYFGEVAPHCPISRDQPVGLARAPLIRTNIPRAFDLPSAIAAANMLRDILNSLVLDRVINNVYSPPTPPPRVDPGAQIINKQRKSSWSEVSGARVKRKYKYYFKNEDGTLDKEIWVMTERIERMVWQDKGWKTSLAFVYGDKPDQGEPVGAPTNNTGDVAESFLGSVDG